MIKQLEVFTMLFSQLKSGVNDSPTTLAWLSEQKADIRRLSYLVGESAEKIKKERAVNPHKQTVVPPGFITAWREYEKYYESEIQQIVEAERKEGAEEFIEQVKQIAERGNKDPDMLWEKILLELDARKEPGDSFDPIEDSPAELIGDILLTYEQVVEEGILSDEAADKAIGAWRFFEKTLGLSHKAIYERWKRIPDLLVPTHVLSVNPKPIFELYNEAVRCYVYGNKVAAISMCRALLEHIFRRHYQIESDALDKTIAIAEGRFKRFKKLKMQEKRKLANKIMHEYEKRPDIDDEAVVEYLHTIKTIVQNIPK